MCVELVFTIIFVLFTLKDKPTTARALAVQFPGSFMNFSFEFGSALGNAEMLFFSASTPRIARAATYPSFHYLYPGLSSRGESGRRMKLTGHILTVQRIRILEDSVLLSHTFHFLVLDPLYHCVVTIFTTCINIKQFYIVPRQCVFCIILTTDYVYIPTYEKADICNGDAVYLFEVVIYNLQGFLFPRSQTL